MAWWAWGDGPTTGVDDFSVFFPNINDSTILWFYKLFWVFMLKWSSSFYQRNKEIRSGLRTNNWISVLSSILQLLLHHLPMMSGFARPLQEQTLSRVLASALTFYRRIWKRGNCIFLAALFLLMYNFLQ